MMTIKSSNWNKDVLVVMRLIGGDVDVGDEGMIMVGVGGNGGIVFVSTVPIDENR